MRAFGMVALCCLTACSKTSSPGISGADLLGFDLPAIPDVQQAQDAATDSGDPGALPDPGEDPGPVADLASELSGPDIPDTTVDVETTDPGLCAEFCAKVAQCAALGTFGSDMAGCVAQCKSRVLADTDFVNNLLCAKVAQCPEIANCLGETIPKDPACGEMCEILAKCGLLSSQNWGSDAFQCTFGCTGYFASVGGKDREAITACVIANLPAFCDPDVPVLCAIAGDPKVCAEACASKPDCAKLAFPGGKSCVDYCSDLFPGSRLALASCMVTTSCGKATAERCFPPANTKSENQDAFCAAVAATCKKGSMEIPSQQPWCAWVATGLEASLGLAADLSGAAVCLNQEGIDPCGQETWLVAACAAAEYAGCSPYCDRLVECAVFPDTEADRFRCRKMCDLAGALDAAALELSLSCVSGAADCGTVAKCVPQL